MDPNPDLVHQVVDLVARFAHLDLGVDNAGRADDLLDNPGRGTPLVLAGRRGHEHHLRRDRQELLERLGPVVDRAGQPEPVVDERLLPRPVALGHAADLGHGLMGLVDETNEVVGEVVEQAVRPLAGLAAVEDSRVVLDPRAEPELAEHLHVVLGALAQAMGLEQLALGLELRAPLVELAPDLGDRVVDHALADVVVRRRPDADVLEVVLDELARQRVEVLEVLDLVTEHHDPERGLGVRGEDLERLAADPERPARERGVVTRVLDRDQLPQDPSRSIISPLDSVCRFSS